MAPAARRQIIGGDGTPSKIGGGGAPIIKIGGGDDCEAARRRRGSRAGLYVRHYNLA